MSDVIRKCHKDGTEFGDSFAGACPICNGPLEYYCKKHNEWLVGPACLKCSPPAAQPARGISSDTVFMVGAGLLLVVIIGLAVFAIQRLVHKSTETSAVPVTTTAAPPKPTPPQPKPAPPPVAPTKPSVPVKAEAGPAFPTYPPASVTMADILRDPDKFEGKLVQVAGTSQFVEADKFTFDLRDGNRTLQVSYRYATPQSKANVAGSSRLVVSGLLKRLEQEDAWQIVAQSIEAR